MKELIDGWFEAWESGNYRAIPVTDHFTHTSPFGTVEGKAEYLALVEANEDSFLGFRFEIHDQLHGDGVACVRYTARKGDFSLDASEWFLGGDHGIETIISYYNVGDVSYEDTAG